jgi:hypothetical protein
MRRWLACCSLALAVILIAGRVSTSQTPDRVDAAGTTVDTGLPAREVNQSRLTKRLSRGREAAAGRRRISETPPNESTARLPRVPPGLDSRSSEDSEGTSSQASSIRDRTFLLPVDDDTAEEADLSPSPSKTGRMRQVAFEADQKQAVPDDDWQKRFELQNQKIEILEKMVRLTADQVKQQGPSLEELQAQMATIESRSRQAADRDQQLADGLDNLNDHIDAGWRYGPQLPSQLKEWFLPGGTNETPLAIYGSVVQNYSQVNGQAGQFDAGTISPYFLLQLNNRFLLESVVDLSADGTIGITQIQMDYIASDAVTVVVGRYLTPFGFFNERLNHEWINKMTDTPLMFSQVSPLISTNGLQVRGSQYVLGSPVKLEYSLYGGNSASLGTAPDSPANQQVTDLAAITSAPGAVNALGGRLGLWVPELGINVGMSGYSQGAYTPAAGDRFQMYGVDASYHKGNWDARVEFAQNYQQANSYIGNDIRRTGMYTQLAYRDYQNTLPILASLELVGRFSMARFSGIDPTTIDLTAFAPGTAPVDRNQYTLGINYYLYPSLVLKFDYEWNPALGGIVLNDNTFMSQFVWAF